MTRRSFLSAVAAWLGITRKPKLDADGHNPADCYYCKANRLGPWS